MMGMSPRQFAWALRARGPDMAAWPARERCAAMMLLRRDAASRDMLAEALAAEDAPAFDAPALDRVTCPVRHALAPLTPIMRRMRWGALGVCVAAGLAIGMLSAPTDPAATDLLPVLNPTMSATVLAALDQ